MSTDLTDLQLDKHGHFSLIKYADDGSIIIPVAKDMVDEKLTKSNWCCLGLDPQE